MGATGIERPDLPVDAPESLLRRRRGLRPKNIITAVAHGHQAAISIDLFCKGKNLEARPPHSYTLVSQKMGTHEWSYDNQVSEDEAAVPAEEPSEVAAAEDAPTQTSTN